MAMNQGDPVVIREWARRRRNARRGFIVLFSALGMAIAVGFFAAAFMSEFARVATLMAVATVVVIVFLITIPIINSCDLCPACGESPLLPTYEVRWFDEADDRPFTSAITACERCGAALK